jgi:hypothetical protein
VDIVRQLRKTAVKVVLEKEMAPYAAWKEYSELLYRAANEIERLRSQLDGRDALLQLARQDESEGRRSRDKESPAKASPGGWLERALR